jgi:hypothetical protein
MTYTITWNGAPRPELEDRLRADMAQIAEDLDNDMSDLVFHQMPLTEDDFRGPSVLLHGDPRTGGVIATFTLGGRMSADLERELMVTVALMDGRDAVHDRDAILLTLEGVVAATLMLVGNEDPNGVEKLNSRLLNRVSARLRSKRTRGQMLTGLAQALSTEPCAGGVRCLA